MTCNYFLGVDTSAYTSSLAIIDENAKIICNLRKVLDVEKGKKGLRQQEALFQHMNNLPKLLENIDYKLIEKIRAIGVTDRPRNIDGSYMPVFLQGMNFAKILGKVLNVNLYNFSHQEGHIASVLINNNIPLTKFISLHISGGTTEILLVNKSKSLAMNIEIIGRSLDISIGQLIDRIGVYLGLNFPAGKEMDEISSNGRVLDLNIPISIKNRYFLNLSGLENYFKKLIDSNNYRSEDIIKTLFFNIKEILLKWIKNVYEDYGLDNIIMTGGVSANRYIRESLEKELDGEISILFPKVDLSTDNAVGTAYLALGKYKEEDN